MKKIIVVGLFINIAVFVAGNFLGFERGRDLGYKKGMEDLLPVKLTVDATEAFFVRKDVELLYDIHNGNNNKYIELLEIRVDNDVMYLDNMLQHKQYSSTMKTSILDALRAAKVYREKYPEHKPPKSISKAVEDALRNISD